MRVTTIVFVTALAGLMVSPPAYACPDAGGACLPHVVVFPVYTPEGGLVGAVGSRVRRPARLEASAVTGQPMTVIYNDPTRRPGAVEPELELQALPRVPRFRTMGAYPRGY